MGTTVPELGLMISKIIASTLAELLAPIVTLFYREGWFNTPDDPVSPRGVGEPFMRKLHAKVGPWLADWWWLGIRNRAYGLKYALKPALFRSVGSYEQLPTQRHTRGRVRTTTVAGFPEWAIDCGRFHVLVGYRVTPIYSEILDNQRRRDERWPLIPFRPVNMDARPILSVRMGAPD
jgi:hypothetical protein